MSSYPKPRQNADPFALGAVDYYATKHGVDPKLAMGVADQETGFRGYDPTSKSPAGAVGTMQVMKGTGLRHVSPERFNTAEGQIEAGVLELKRLSDKHKGDVKAITKGYLGGAYDPYSGITADQYAEHVSGFTGRSDDTDPFAESAKELQARNPQPITEAPKAVATGNVEMGVRKPVSGTGGVETARTKPPATTTAQSILGDPNQHIASQMFEDIFEEQKFKGDLEGAKKTQEKLREFGYEVGNDEYGNPYIKRPKITPTVADPTLARMSDKRSWAQRLRDNEATTPAVQRNLNRRQQIKRGQAQPVNIDDPVTRGMKVLEPEPLGVANVSMGHKLETKRSPVTAAVEMANPLAGVLAQAERVFSPEHKSNLTDDVVNQVVDGTVGLVLRAGQSAATMGFDPTRLPGLTSGVNSVAAKGLEKTRRWLAEQTENEGRLGGAAHTAAGVLPYIGAGAVAGHGGVAVLGALDMAQSLADEAEAYGGTPEQIERARAGGAAIGMLSALPYAQAIKYLRGKGMEEAVAKSFLRQIMDVPLQTAKGMAEMGGIQYASNLVASDVAGYDPNRNPSKGLQRAMTVGALLGAIPAMGGVAKNIMAEEGAGGGEATTARERYADYDKEHQERRVNEGLNSDSSIVAFDDAYKIPQVKSLRDEYGSEGSTLKKPQSESGLHISIRNMKGNEPYAYYPENNHIIVDGKEVARWVDEGGNQKALDQIYAIAEKERTKVDAPESPEEVTANAQTTTPRSEIQPMAEVQGQQVEQPVKTVMEGAKTESFDGETDEHYGGKLKVEKFKGLSDSDRAIERRAAAELESDPQKFVDEYVENNTKKGVLTINTDDAREQFKEYAESHESRATRAAAVQEPAGAIAKEVFKRELAKPVDEDRPVVLFTAGGGGSGKSFAVDNVPTLEAIKQDSAFVYDTTMAGYESSVKKINQVLNSGRAVHITMIFTPEEIGAMQAYERGTKKGRTVPEGQLASDHYNAPITIARLADRFADDPRVAFSVVENKGKGHKIREMSLDELRGKAYTRDRKEVEQNVKNGIRKSHTDLEESGQPTYPYVYKGFTGEEAPNAQAAGNEGNNRITPSGSGRQEGGVDSHHSNFQPRESDGTFKEGKPEDYKERGLPKTLESAGLEGGSDRIYRVVHDEQAVKTAKENLASKGVDGAAEFVRNSPPSAETTATAIAAIDEYQRLGKAESDPIKKADLFSKAGELASDLSAKLTQAGQATSAARVAQEFDTAQAVMTAEKIAKQNGKKVDSKRTEQITDAAIKIQEANKKIQELESIIADFEAKKNAKAKSQKQKLIDALSQQEAEAMKRLEAMNIRPREVVSTPAERGAVGGVKADPQTIADLASVQAVKVAKGEGDLASIRAEMSQQFGGLYDANRRLIEKGVDQLLKAQNRQKSQASPTARAELNKEVKKEASAENQFDYKIKQEAESNSNDPVSVGAKLLAEKNMSRGTFEKEMVERFGDVYTKAKNRIYKEAFERVRAAKESHRDLAEIYRAHREGAVTPEQIQIVQKRLENARKAHREASLELSRHYDSLAGGRTLRIFSGVRKAGLLSALRTHLRNLTGNASYQMFDEVSRIPGVVVDYAVSAVTGQRSLDRFSPSASLDSVAAALKTGGKEALEIMKHGQTAEQAAKLQIPEELNSGIKILDLATNTVFRAMSAEDRVFYNGALRRNLIDRARVQALNEVRRGELKNSEVRRRTNELVKEPSDELKANAEHDALILTFNNSNKLSDAIKQARSKLSPTANFALDLVMPFDRTPTNIVARTLEASPLGFGKAAKTLAKSIINKSMSVEEQRQFSQTMGRATTGTAIITLGFVLGSKGLMSAYYDEDERAENKANKLQGKSPMALKVGNQWITIGDTNVGKLLAIGATLQDKMKKEGAMAAATTSGKVLLEQPLLGTVKGLGGAITSKDKLADYLGRQASSFIPAAGMVRDIATATDDKARKTFGFKGKVYSSIPGLRNTLPEDVGAQHRRTWAIDPFRMTTSKKP